MDLFWDFCRALGSSCRSIRSQKVRVSSCRKVSRRYASMPSYHSGKGSGILFKRRTHFNVLPSLKLAASPMLPLGTPGKSRNPPPPAGWGGAKWTARGFERAATQSREMTSHSVGCLLLRFLSGAMHGVVFT